MNKQLLEKLYRWQFPFYMLGTLVLAFFWHEVESRIMPVLLMFWLFYGAFAFLNSHKSRFKTLYTFLLIYIVFSVIGYISNDLPFKYYYGDFRGLVVPMMAVYIGMTNNDESIYKWFVLSTVFCVVVGLYLYFVQPSWYLSFKVAALENSFRYSGSNISELNVMALTTSGRFSSFFPTTYPVAYFTTFSICITLNDMYKEVDNRLFKSNWVLLSILGILIVGIILTLTRVAIAYIILLVFYYFIYGYINKSKNRHLVRGIMIAIAALVFVAFIRISASEYGSFVLERMSNRLTLDATNELTEGSRADQKEVTLSAWNNIVFGDGLGSKGGAARAENKPGITDDDWIRVMVEFGVIGFILLIIVYGMTINKALKNRKYMMAELTIVLYGVLSMLVADTMYKGALVLILWFSIGRIWNKELYIKRVKDNNKI